MKRYYKHLIAIAVLLIAQFYSLKYDIPILLIIGFGLFFIASISYGIRTGQLFPWNIFDYPPVRYEIIMLFYGSILSFSGIFFGILLSIISQFFKIIFMSIPRLTKILEKLSCPKHICYRFGRSSYSREGKLYTMKEEITCVFIIQFELLK